MEKVTDESFGIVPVYKDGVDWRVLIVHQISYKGGEHRFWTFPKGHPEANESPTETAKRELMEETSIVNVQIIEDAQFSVRYQFTHENKWVDKTVTYFLGLCSDTETKIVQPEEIAEIGWFSIKDAAERLTHKKSQNILMEAAQYINKHKL